MRSIKFIALAVAAILAVSGIYNFYQKNNLTDDSTKSLSEKNIANQTPASLETEKSRQIAEAYGRLPINFEPNVGQTDERVKFVARGQGYSLFLTDGEAVLALKKARTEEHAVVRMRMDGANPSPKIEGAGASGSKTNYFIGSNPENWRTNVANYSKVKYESVYDGIDAVFYGSGQQLEYDFVVAPNADPNQIRLKFDGLKNAEIDKTTGDLLLETGGAALRQHKPSVYQNIDGERKEINASYAIQNSKKESFSVTFELGEYDKSKELVIDPVLAYGSYLGGTVFDEGRAVTVDAQGNAYVSGTSASLNFPTTAGTVKPALLPATNANQYWYDAFVAKVNPTGTALVFSTYFGGRNGNESGSGVAVDAAGNVLLSGTTMAGDLPTVNAYQSTFGGTDDA
jgi:hypothetical protein